MCLEADTGLLVAQTVYHLWYVDCSLGMPVLELLIHLNTAMLINKGSDLETTVSFYLSLGDFIFSVFVFSSYFYRLRLLVLSLSILLQYF